MTVSWGSGTAIPAVPLITHNSLGAGSGALALAADGSWTNTGATVTLSDGSSQSMDSYSPTHLPPADATIIWPDGTHQSGSQFDAQATANSNPAAAMAAVLNHGASQSTGTTGTQKPHHSAGATTSFGSSGTLPVAGGTGGSDTSGSPGTSGDHSGGSKGGGGLAALLGGGLTLGALLGGAGGAGGGAAGSAAANVASGLDTSVTLGSTGPGTSTVGSAGAASSGSFDNLAETQIGQLLSGTSDAAQPFEDLANTFIGQLLGDASAASDGALAAFKEAFSKLPKWLQHFIIKDIPITAATSLTSFTIDEIINATKKGAEADPLPQEDPSGGGGGANAAASPGGFSVDTAALGTVAGFWGNASSDLQDALGKTASISDGGPPATAYSDYDEKTGTSATHDAVAAAVTQLIDNLNTVISGTDAGQKGVNKVHSDYDEQDQIVADVFSGHQPVPVSA